MQRLSVLAACAFLVVTGTPAGAGELWATFGSRLRCRYSSFAVAEVKTVRRDSVDVAFTKNLLRRPSTKTARISISPKYDHYARGEKLLINAWHFPAGNIQHWPTGPDRSFPSSFYHGHRDGYWVLARIGADGKLSAIYAELGPILDWLYSTGNWDIRITETKFARDGGQVYDIVFPDGRRETVTFPVRKRAAASVGGPATPSRRAAPQAGTRPKR